MNQSILSPEAFCRNSPTNAFYNNATATPDQSVINAALLPPLLSFVIVGAIASVFNIICIVVFVTKKDLRQKYFLFAFLAFANLINTVFMFEAGIMRRHFIFTNRLNQLISTFECLQYPGPHLQILGGQLPALVLFVIDFERLLAVYKPMFFKVYITDRNRIFIVIGCSVMAFISLFFGYLSSYMNRATCVNSYCAVMSAYGLHYSNYNSLVVILFPVFALILNIFTYIGARRLGKHADMKKELKLILLTLIITFVDVGMIAVPNILLMCSYNGISLGFINLGYNFLYLYVCFCCNSAVNLFVYICFKRDFRNHLLTSISFCGLKQYLNETKQRTNTHPTRMVAPRNTTNVPILRRSVQSTECF